MNKRTDTLRFDAPGKLPDAGAAVPDRQVSVRDVFGLDIDMTVPAFSSRAEHVPDIDPAYRFDRDTTLAILAGFAYNQIGRAHV